MGGYLNSVNAEVVMGRNHVRRYGHVLLLDLLRTRGLDVDIIDSEGRTPLMLSVVYNQVCLVDAANLGPLASIFSPNPICYVAN